MSTTPISLGDHAALDAGLVGAKAASVARLHSTGFTVPDGVVLPAALLATWPSGEQAPPALRDHVVQACATLGGPLAVRTSATWEDSALRSHAGATTTVLDVDGTDAVLEAIRVCIDGSARARRQHGATGSEAILLQRLVAAEHAGVAFTADPVSGQRDVVRIAATEGLGEALVQGNVVGIDVTVRGQSIEGDLASLPRETALAVADLARKVEAELGQPQDIEWAVTGEQVHLLQARPITVLPQRPEPPTGNNWQKDTAHYPEPLTPFGFSVVNIGEDAVRGVFDSVGMLIRGLDERFVGGEVYGRVLPAIGSPDAAGSPPPALLLGLAARVVPELRRRTATAARVFERDQLTRWVQDWESHVRKGFCEQVDRLAGQDLASMDDHALAVRHDQLVKVVVDGLRVHFQLVMPLAHRLYDLHTLVGDTLGWEDARTSRMLAGHSPATRAAEAAMRGLRERLRATPGAVTALQADATDPVGAIRAHDPALAADLEAWIDAHGWGLVNYDAGVPVLAERPTTVTALLLADPRPPASTHAETAEQEARQALPAGTRARFDRLLAAAREAYSLREDNIAVAADAPSALLRRWMLEVADRLVARDVLPAAGDAVYLTVHELRALLVDSADAMSPTDPVALVRQRRNEEAWVRANPGPAYLGEQAPPPDVSRLPEPLRRMNAPILWFVGHEYPPPTEVPADPAVLHAGVPVSPGVQTGRVRVIRSHTDIGLLREGEVLVCQVTSPAWSPIFPLARALVADGGGVLSHAAIAAREHGLPAVLGTGDATSSLADGQMVTVDGTRGLVLVAGQSVGSDA